MKVTGKENIGAIAEFEISGDTLGRKNMGRPLRKLKSSKPMTIDEINEACEIEEIQSALFKPISKYIKKYGIQRVLSALDWFDERLKQETQ